MEGAVGADLDGAADLVEGAEGGDFVGEEEEIAGAFGQEAEAPGGLGAGEDRFDAGFGGENLAGLGQVLELAEIKIEGAA